VVRVQNVRSLAQEIDVKTATGIRKTKLFKRVSLTVEGRQGEFTCTELARGEDPLLGLIPLEELGLQPDVGKLKAYKSALGRRLLRLTIMR
jgi:hypothetical protein